MPQPGPPLQRETARWKYVLIGGLTALPFTALSYWQTGSELSLGAVLCGGILAGYLVTRAGGERSGVGIRVGLVGGLPVLWVLFDVLAATSALGGPTWFVTSATVLTIGYTIVVAILGFGMAALIGEAGTRVGYWLADKQPGKQNPVVDG
jgi:hypothetical protein